MKKVPRSSQSGVFTVITAFASVFLVLLLAFVVDLSRILVIKGELQTMADTCALAAVVELNGKLGETTRGTSAGKKVVSFNKKNFQSESISIFSFTFRTTNPKRVTCTVTSSDNNFFFLNNFGYDFGTINAVATGELKPTLKACVLPIALKKRSGNADYAVNTQSDEIKSNLRIWDLRYDRSEPFDFRSFIEGYGFCEIQTKYRDIFVELLPNSYLIDSLNIRRTSSNPSRLFLSVPLVSSMTPINVNSENSKIEKWVCLELKSTNMDIAYVGLVGFGSPCITMGLTGTGVDAVGPMAPVLTR
ncbi:MAG: hypothetical protein CFE38_13880 [Comamonadaceae bacterium PBBC1]|nr:MAG: hypothetical protein CFE38_13880 [Comamonadaceae bacterium PBBC1]